MKVLIPFIAWSIIGLLLNKYYYKIWRNKSFSIESVIDYIVNVRIVGIYYFMVDILIVYTLIPIFSFIDREHKKKIVYYTFLVLFLLNSFIPFIIIMFNLKIAWG